MRRARRTAGFSLIELLVVVGAVVALLGLLLPAASVALERARVAKGAANLRAGAAASLQHAIDHRGRLPQAWTEIAPGDFVQSVHGFAGSRGTLAELGLDGLGADARPLNQYLGTFGPDSVVESMRDPLDRGAREALPLVHAVATRSMFELVGASYILNTHALDEVPCPYVPTVRTLTPGRDEPMPPVASPARTWLIADHAVYNHDGGADAGFLWRRHGRLVANMAFVDGHVKVDIAIPAGAANETEAYSFYPTPDWADDRRHPSR